MNVGTIDGNGFKKDYSNTGLNLLKNLNTNHKYFKNLKYMRNVFITEDTFQEVIKIIGDEYTFLDKKSNMYKDEMLLFGIEYLQDIIYNTYYNSYMNIKYNNEEQLQRGLNWYIGTLYDNIPILYNISQIVKKNILDDIKIDMENKQEVEQGINTQGMNFDDKTNKFGILRKNILRDNNIRNNYKMVLSKRNFRLELERITLLFKKLFIVGI